MGYEKLAMQLKAPSSKASQKKAVDKMHQLFKIQIGMMQLTMTKIDRKSRAIKKQEKIVNDNLKRKRIFLDQDNFDILSVIQQSE